MSAPPTPSARPPLLVETPEALAALALALAREPRIALDTEANSLHAFRERVCVVQLSVGDEEGDAGADAIVDPLAVPDIAPLRALVDREDVEIVFHGGDYDVSMLSREHDFRFHRVFDTMIAATLLGESKLGLSALVEKSRGVVLSKKYQTADWARRPFSPVQLDYLRNDTRFLLALSSELAARLAAADLVEEAEIEFRRLAARRGKPREDDPDAWRALTGAEKLDATGRAVLSRAFAWRDERAKAHDVPRFRIVANEALVALASKPPADAAALAKIPGFSSVAAEGDADALLAVVRAGTESAMKGEAPPPTERPRRTPEERAHQDAVRDREERLRRWRNDEARVRNVPNLVVLPNVALRAMAESPPAGADELARMPDVGAKRAARYATEILKRL